MELMAAISALEALKRPCVVDLHTDSEYVRSGITTWIHGWKKNGWRTSDKKSVKNVDLWKRLDEALGHHKVHWHWVKGHAGHAQNERADELAREGVVAARAGAMKTKWSNGRDIGVRKHAVLWTAMPAIRKNASQNLKLCQ